MTFCSRKTGRALFVATFGLLAGCGAVKGLQQAVSGAKPAGPKIPEAPREVVAPRAGPSDKPQFQIDEEAAEVKRQAALRPVPPEDIVVVEPEPGLEKVAPLVAPWCAGLPESSAAQGGLLRRLYDSNSSKGAEGLTKIATAICNNPRDPSWQKMTAALVQTWVNFTGLSAKDAIAALGARVQADEWKKQRDDFCAPFKVPEESSREQRELAKVLTDVHACGGQADWENGRGGRMGDIEWYVDRQEHPSEILRAALVLAHFMPLREGDEPARRMIGYITFGPDARRLDRARLEKELADPRYNEFGRITARELHARAAKVAKGYKETLEKAVAADPDLRELYFDAPERTWKAWAAMRAANKAAFDVAEDYERKAFAPSRKASAGCGAPLRDALQKYVAAGKLRSYDAAAQRAVDPVGHAILSRLMVCEAFEKNLAQSVVLRGLYEKAKPHRGPRAAVVAEAIAVLNKLLDDRPNLPIDPSKIPTIHGKDLFELTFAGTAHHTRMTGKTTAMVKSVKAEGAQLRVEFQTETWKEPTWRCTPTNRISRIRADGVLEYEENCVQTGWESLSRTEKPVIVPSFAAAGIAAGRLLIFNADEQDSGARIAAPLAVHEGREQKQLFSFLGMAL